ncbi:MAG: phosphoglucosamine mutase [Candidatus Nanopelagicales bacterium]
MTRLFGTDGVRGLANKVLTAPLALDLSVAAARVLRPQDATERPFAVVGRDPRASGEFLEAAVCAGLASSGVDVLRVGVLPTPAVAFLTAELDATFGVMLSASHNPMPDNGIKFFAAGGSKLPDAVEDEIEGLLGLPFEAPVGADVGRITDAVDAAQRYLDHLALAVPNKLKGVKLVVDGANGAASVVGPAAYRLAGAEVIEIHTNPDGLNINLDCGSTHMGDLVSAVLEHGADLGLAHDGDADRCLAVDANGELIDGDQILAILAMAMLERGHLADNTVVATVMSNLGFIQAMEANGISVIQAAVGDRYVLEAMGEGGFNLGGEQSGHVILSEFATTGDGVLTGLMLAAQIASSGKSIAELAAIMTKLPQVLINVSGVDRGAVESNEELQAAVTAAELQLGSRGRVLLRPSGTEPLVRVMVEAPTEAEANEVATQLADAVSRCIPLTPGG